MNIIFFFKSINAQYFGSSLSIVTVIGRRRQFRKHFREKQYYYQKIIIIRVILHNLICFVADTNASCVVDGRVGPWERKLDPFRRRRGPKYDDDFITDSFLQWSSGEINGRGRHGGSFCAECVRLLFITILMDRKENKIEKKIKIE